MVKCTSLKCNHTKCLSTECNHTSCLLKNDYKTFDCSAFVKRLQAKHSNRIPVCVLDHTKDSPPKLHRFLVSDNSTVYGFLVMVRNRAKLDSDQAIFVLTLNNSLIPTSKLLSEVQSFTVNGMMVLHLHTENAFGN